MMKVNVLKEDLIHAMKALKPYVGDGRTLSYDKYLYMESLVLNGQYTLRLMVVNSIDSCEITINSAIASSYTQGVCALIEFNKFFNLIQLLETPMIDIDCCDVDNVNTVYISYLGCNDSIKLNGEDPSLFPNFPELIPNETLSIPFDRFCSGITVAGSIVTQNDLYPLYNCVNITLKNRSILFESIDSKDKRMIVYEEDMLVPNVIIGSFFAELSRLKKLTQLDASIASMMLVEIADNGIQFNIDNFKIFTRVITGSFPDCVKLIPANFISSLNFDKNQMMLALDKAKILSENDKKICVIKITADTSSPGFIEINASSLSGSLTESIPHSNYTGKDVELTFKIDTLYEGLKVINDKNITWLFPNINFSFFKEATPSSLNNYHYLIPSIKTV